MLKIKNYLKKNQVSLSRYINLCLYQKDQGVYQKKTIGKHFITAPEVSQLFGECVSIFFLLILKKHKIKNFCELGPGNGTLMKDIIRSIQKFIDYPLTISLYEKSDYYRNLQIRNLNNLKSEKIKLNFLSRFKLKRKPYFFICNEFFDALPINQFEKKDNRWFEKRVTFKNGFRLVDKLINVNFSKKFVNGDIIEESPLSNLYMKIICNHIKKYGGGLLVFDYGPFKKGNIDTLQALYRSKKCGIFDHPFESDITYHVNFEQMIKISNKYKLKSYGPISQRKFLFYHGINERFTKLSENAESSKITKNLEKQFERLTSPYGMGSLIKCLFISNDNIESSAFSI